MTDRISPQDNPTVMPGFAPDGIQVDNQIYLIKGAVLPEPDFLY
jgi:hypothetical protein